MCIYDSLPCVCVCTECMILWLQSALTQSRGRESELRAELEAVRAKLNIVSYMFPHVCMHVYVYIYMFKSSENDRNEDHVHTCKTYTPKKKQVETHLDDVELV
jgi:hypothetical protein